jgi:hypothetical protein
MHCQVSLLSNLAVKLLDYHIILDKQLKSLICILCSLSLEMRVQTGFLMLLNTAYKLLNPLLSQSHTVFYLG